jgi:hypothetical protein
MWQPAMSVIAGFDWDEAGRAPLLFAAELYGEVGM